MSVFFIVSILCKPIHEQGENARNCFMVWGMMTFILVDFGNSIVDPDLVERSSVGSEPVPTAEYMIDILFKA